MKVTVFRRANRTNYEAQWTDPVTGRKITRSMGTPRQRDAERKAAAIERELREGLNTGPTNPTWKDFRGRFEAEYLAGLAETTALKDQGTLNLIETIIQPARIAAVDAQQVAKITAHLRKAGRKDYTIKSHMINIRKMLKWACRLGMIAKVPHIDMPSRPIGTRGRPITEAELAAMIAKIPSVIGEKQAPSWEFLIRGLFQSGLRLSEALSLTWGNGLFAVDMCDPHPLFRIRAAGQKNRKDQVSPVAPEFALILQEIPESDRTGFVFDPRPQRGSGRLTMSHVSRIISDVGRAAEVIVDDSGKPASAHDLRRSFGDRWSHKVMPGVLQKLMRHQSVVTTLEFYASRDASMAAETVWQRFTDTSADSATISQEMSDDNKS